MSTIFNLFGQTFHISHLPTYPKNSIIILFKDVDNGCILRYTELTEGIPNEYLKFQLENADFNKYHIVNKNIANFEEVKKSLLECDQDYSFSHDLGYINR